MRGLILYLLDLVRARGDEVPKEAIRLSLGCSLALALEFQGALVTPLARTWPVAGRNKGQQLGRAAADVLMRLTNRLTLRSPGLTRLRDGLVRTGLILTPHWDAYTFSDAVREFDEPLLL